MSLPEPSRFQGQHSKTGEARATVRNLLGFGRGAELGSSKMAILERTVGSFELPLRIISSLTIVMSCVAAIAELAHVFSRESLVAALPDAAMPVPLAFATMYASLVVLAFSSVYFVCRTNLIGALFLPLIVLATYWFGLQLRQYAFLDWIQAGAYCGGTAGTVWSLVSLFQLGMMGFSLVGMVVLGALRLRMGGMLDARWALYATGAAVLLSMLLLTPLSALLFPAHDAPSWLGYAVTVPAFPYIETVHVFSGSTSDLWVLGCQG
jgi:hypothetical protein